MFVSTDAVVDYPTRKTIRLPSILHKLAELGSQDPVIRYTWLNIIQGMDYIDHRSALRTNYVDTTREDPGFTFLPPKVAVE